MRNRANLLTPLLQAPSLRERLSACGNHGPGFDTIRLVAASAVVLHHSLFLKMDIVRDDWLFALSGGYTHLGLLAVSVFFALSGFLVTPGLWKTGNITEYLSRRFMRIMPLLTVVVALTAFVVGPALTILPLDRYFSSPQTWIYLKNITTSLSPSLPGVTNYEGGTVVNSPLWTLRFEWLCYLLLAGASLLGLLGRRRLFLLAWAVSQIGMLMYFGPIPEGSPKTVSFVLLYLFGYFGAGTLMFLYGDRIVVSGRLMGLAFLALIAAWWSGFTYGLAPILTIYLVVGIGLIRFPWSKLLARADLSYGVYLSHAVIMTIVMHVHPFQSSLALFATCLLLGYAVAWTSWTFLEKPALQHKSLPAQIVRNARARLRQRITPTENR